MIVTSFWLTNICVNTFWSHGIGALISLSSPYTNSSPLWSTFVGTLKIFHFKYSEFVWKVAADWRPTQDSAHNLLPFICKLWLTFWHISISLYPNFWASGKLWLLRKTEICICQKLYLDCQRLTSLDLRDTNVMFLVKLKFATRPTFSFGFRKMLLVM